MCGVFRKLWRAKEMFVEAKKEMSEGALSPTIMNGRERERE